MKNDLEKFAFWLQVKEEQGNDLSKLESDAVEDYIATSYIECRDCDAGDVEE